MKIDHARLMTLANKIVAAGGSKPEEASIVADICSRPICAVMTATASACWSPMCGISRRVR